MRVILLKDIPGFGKTGDLKSVSGGYGRNYLIPQKLAVLAAASEVENWKARQMASERRIEKERNAALATKEKIESIEMHTALASGKDGGIFGSIRNENIAEFLKSHGIEVPKTAISLEQPIKKDGNYAVHIFLNPEITATLRLIVALSQQP